MIEMPFLFNFKVPNCFTSVFASGKFIDELIFANGFFFFNANSENPKKGHRVGEKKYPSICTGVGQGNSTHAPE